ncbi:MAG: hypothetical protein V4490_01300, partial [Pseudomonadota bacterium]
FTNNHSHLLLHCFDFSAFFSVYPLLRANNTFTPQLGLTILMSSIRQHNIMLTEPDSPHQVDIVPSVKEKIGEYLIPFEQHDSIELQQRGLDFIQLYETVYTMILGNGVINIEDTIARAYVINEDRFYLFPVFSIEAHLIEWQSYYPAKVIHRFIQRLIQANQRKSIKNKDGEYTSNVRLFIEGMFTILIHSDGNFRVVIHVDRDMIALPTSTEDQWAIEFHGKRMSADCVITDNVIQLFSQKLPMIQLTRQYTRDDVFLIPQCVFYLNEKSFKLTDFFFPKQDEEFYL